MESTRSKLTGATNVASPSYDCDIRSSSRAPRPSKPSGHGPNLTAAWRSSERTRAWPAAGTGVPAGA
eukprot:5540980-Pyramimonas_sp.AAC.1